MSPGIRSGHVAVALLWIAASLPGAACRAAERSAEDADTTTSVRGGTLVLGNVSDVDSWNEYTSSQTFANTILRRIFLRLADAVEGGRPAGARVRRRAVRAQEDPRLVDDLMFGYGKVSTGPVPSFRWQSNAALEPLSCDSEQAVRILARRGFTPREGDGALARDGRPLELRMLTNAGNRLREAMQVKIQAQLREIGIRLDVRAVEMGSLIGRMREGDFDAYLLGMTYAGTFDVEPLLHSEGASNFVGYRSEKVDRQLWELSGADDHRERKRALDAIQVELQQDLPYTFLDEEERLVAFRDRVRGISIPRPCDPLGSLAHYWVTR
jgi:ABC-type oligopeptide transport system substrate-binding subunit